MMLNKFVRIVMVSLLALVLVGCSETVVVVENNDDVDTSNTVNTETTLNTETTVETEIIETIYPITITDKFGDEVVIEKEPETMISFSPEITEIIFALEENEGLIGRSKYCNYPLEAENVETFGTLRDVNVESVVEAAPDVVFVSSMAGEEMVSTMKAHELTVVALDKDGTLDGTYEYMENLGKILNASDQAEALIAEIKGQIKGVVEKVAGLEKPKVYYVVWAGNGHDSTATGDTFIHGILEAAGGDNVAKDGTGWSYTVEKIVEDNPDLLICSQGEMKANIVGMPGYEDLSAVKEGRVYEVDQDMFSRQGPRIGEAVETAAKIFHSEVFK